MKKLFFLLTTVLAVTFSSCKKDDKDQNTHIGTWQVIKITETRENGESIIDYDHTRDQWITIFKISTDGSIIQGSANKDENTMCGYTLNYTIENNQFAFTNNPFLYINSGEAKLEFKDNNNIIITGTDTNNTTHTIELTKTDKKIDDFTIVRCEE